MGAGGSSRLPRFPGSVFLFRGFPKNVLTMEKDDFIINYIWKGFDRNEPFSARSERTLPGCKGVCAFPKRRPSWSSAVTNGGVSRVKGVKRRGMACAIWVVPRSFRPMMDGGFFFCRLRPAVPAAVC